MKKKLNWLQFTGAALKERNGNLVNSGTRFFFVDKSAQELVECFVMSVEYNMLGDYEYIAYLRVKTSTNKIFKFFIKRLLHELRNDEDDNIVKTYRTIEDYYSGVTICYDLDETPISAQVPFCGMYTNGKKCIVVNGYKISGCEIYKSNEIPIWSNYRISQQSNGALVALFDDDFSELYATREECEMILRENVPVKTFKNPNGTKVIITIDTEKNTIEMVRK